MSYQPNAEMVLIAWLKTIPTVDGSKIATTLPADASKWNASGFITVQSVGGTPNEYTGMRAPVVAINVWGVNLNSEKSPWGRIQQTAEVLFNGFYNPDLFPFLATFDQYGDAMLHTAWPTMEPRKVPGSASGYAHVQFDVAMSWSVMS